MFKGWVLLYDLQNDRAELVRFRGSASDLSDAEIASTEELVEYVPNEAVRGIARLDHLTEKQIETFPANVAGVDPINTLDSEESALEEDPEPVDDLRNVILDERGEDQPCPVGTAANRLTEKQIGTSPANVTGVDPINTLDSKESMLEEDPEPADDLHNVILDERGEDQPCPVGTAANSVMDPQAEAVASAPSPDTATLPTEEALGKPTLPSSNLTETPETQDLGAEDTVVFLREEEMTDFP